MAHLHRKAPWEYAGHDDHARKIPPEARMFQRASVPPLWKSDRPKRQPHEHFRIRKGGA